MNDSIYVSIVRLIGLGWKIESGYLVSPSMSYEELEFLDWMSRP